MLIKYSVLALGLPAVLLAASPRLFRSARSRWALLALVLLLAGVVAMTLHGIRWAQADPTERDFLLMILGAQALFLGACGLALVEQRTLGEEGGSKRAWGGFAVARRR